MAGSTSALARIPDSSRALQRFRKVREGDLVVSFSRKQAISPSYLAVVSLLPNASLPEPRDEVVELTTKLWIARKCVTQLMEPLHGEIRPDCIQLG
jgi:hypothetical protein